LLILEDSISKRLRRFYDGLVSEIRESKEQKDNTSSENYKSELKEQA
jgi:hypothetical protein